MSSLRDLFIRHVGQTSEFSMKFEVSHADGMYIYDRNGKAHLDLNSGISVSSLGHRHPKVIAAIKRQLDKHMHTMVYGEHIQQPQIEFAQLLSKQLDPQLSNVYFVMTGSEAIEVAMKLARRQTGRYEIISCSGAYHGSTQGAEALRSDDDFTRAFLPGIPGIRHINFNELSDLSKITKRTAAVILEPVQAESGVRLPENGYLEGLRQKCTETNTLLIFDEIQTGFGRTGHLFAHKKYNVLPDVLLIAKSMGAGMPIGAVVTSRDILGAFLKNPTLGHITTFGGHPVSTAAAAAGLKVLLDDRIVEGVLEKEQLFHDLLKHKIIEEVRSSGLMMAVQLTKRKYLKHVVSKTFEQGALIDYFLFNDKSFRLAPPLIISKVEIKKACNILLQAMDYALDQYRR